jgi:CheY-like chemotaxis protein
MKTIVFATGSRNFEDAIMSGLLTAAGSGSYESVGFAIHRETVLDLCVDKRPDILILKDGLDGRIDMLDLIRQVKEKVTDIRIIILTKERPVGDAFLASITAYGIYDFISAPKLKVSTLVDLILSPNTYASVSKYLPDFKVDSNGDGLAFKTKIVKEEESSGGEELDDINTFGKTSAKAPMMDSLARPAAPISDADIVDIDRSEEGGKVISQGLDDVVNLNSKAAPLMKPGTKLGYSPLFKSGKVTLGDRFAATKKPDIPTPAQFADPVRPVFPEVDLGQSAARSQPAVQPKSIEEAAESYQPVPPYTRKLNVVDNKPAAPVEEQHQSVEDILKPISKAPSVQAAPAEPATPAAAPQSIPVSMVEGDGTEDHPMDFSAITQKANEYLERHREKLKENAAKTAEAEKQAAPAAEIKPVEAAPAEEKKVEAVPAAIPDPIEETAPEEEEEIFVPVAPIVKAPAEPEQPAVAEPVEPAAKQEDEPVKADDVLDEEEDIDEGDMFTPVEEQVKMAEPPVEKPVEEKKPEPKIEEPKKEEPRREEPRREEPKAEEKHEVKHDTKKPLRELEKHAIPARRIEPEKHEEAPAPVKTFEKPKFDLNKLDFNFPHKKIAFVRAQIDSTHTSLNMAIAMAIRGKKVLLVDTNHLSALGRFIKDGKFAHPGLPDAVCSRITAIQTDCVSFEETLNARKDLNSFDYILADATVGHAVGKVLTACDYEFLVAPQDRLVLDMVHDRYGEIVEKLPHAIIIEQYALGGVSYKAISKIFQKSERALRAATTPEMTATSYAESVPLMARKKTEDVKAAYGETLMFLAGEHPDMKGGETE